MGFSAYVARQRPALMRVATVLTGQTWLAEDLVSDVLCRAFERWDRISGMAEPHAYVRRMVVNDYVSWHRRLAAPRHGPTSNRTPCDRTAPTGTPRAGRDDPSAGRAASAAACRRGAALLRRPLRRRIATELGCRVTTVRSQISRALASLRVDMTATPTIYQETR